MKNLVLLGAGYGNIRALSRLLTSDLPEDVHITLIDRNSFHCFKTEYYALVAGTVPEQHIRIPLPTHEKLKVVYGDITTIDTANKKVELSNGKSVSYDDLIIGLGCEDKYHNVPGAPEHTYSIQTIEKTRNAYENVNSLPPNSVIGVVGAGLSGVEVASELRESRSDLQILLFDRGSRILSMFPEKLSYYVQNWFIEHDVKIISNSNITKVEKNTLFNHDDEIHCDAVIWTAGIQPVEVVRNLDVEKDNTGRIVVTKYHHMPNDEHVYVVGDCASLPYAPSAQLAEAQAEQIVMVLQKKWKGEDLPEVMPQIKLKGIMGSLGKKHGFGLFNERPLIGRVPRLIKSGILWLYKYHNG
ncbi:NAD(P)/FAD-dependent oxidoreductase [Gottfriedia acidiceleris]|jgi:NADH dehydrogenase|uniref:NAD(P)/FAD-dependent oxidoreductase n=1 Tax=Gottfriedia acidiceleris TaxID=371036 RepID=UPI00101D80C1|nr:NAD(P)/FAD-dependent oxidoreductase [Gottfriedia acidiceleris]